MCIIWFVFYLVGTAAMTWTLSPRYTVLMGVLPDQAALAGVLDTLYQNRYPLLYVKYLGAVVEEKQTR